MRASESETYLLLESLKIERREIKYLEYHLDRMVYSMKSIFDAEINIDFAPIEKELEGLTEGVYKLRIVYNNSFFRYKIKPYKKTEIKSLQLVKGNELDYKFKFVDRKILNELYSQRKEADDILIVKSGMITDSYYCNVAFLKEGKWYTPHLPLLHGTKRKQLLEKGLISEEAIAEHNLRKYEKVRLFNAIIEFGDIEIDISNISH